MTYRFQLVMLSQLRLYKAVTRN